MPVNGNDNGDGLDEISYDKVSGTTTSMQAAEAAIKENIISIDHFCL